MSPSFFWREVVGVIQLSWKVRSNFFQLLLDIVLKVLRSCLFIVFTVFSNWGFCNPPLVDGEYVLVSRTFKQNKRSGNAENTEAPFVGTLVIKDGKIQKTFWEKEKPQKKTIFNGEFSSLQNNLFQIELSDLTSIKSMQGQTVQNQLSFNESGDLEIINPSDPDAGFHEVWRKKEKLAEQHPFRSHTFECAKKLSGN